MNTLEIEQKRDSIYKVLEQAKRRKPQEALDISIEVLNEAKNYDLDYFVGLSYEIQGVSYRILGDYVKAVDASFAALRIYDSLKLDNYKASLELQIGSHFANSHDYNQAISLFESALDFFSENDEIMNQALTLINLGETYRLQGNLSKASEHFKACILIDNPNVRSRIKAYAYGNLGLVHFDQDSLLLAKEEIDFALQELEKGRDIHSITVFKAKLGQIYIRSDNFDKGEKIMIDAYQVATDLDLKEQIRDLSLDLSRIYEQQNQYKRSISYYKTYKQQNDSIINIENVREAARIRSKYDIEQKEADILLLEQENRNKKKQVRMLVVGALLLLMMFVVIINEYQKRRIALEELKEKNILLAEREAEKELLLKELNHRVKNNLQMVSSMFSIQARQVDDENARIALNSARLRVDALTLIHQTLYRKDVDTHINLSSYITELANSLVFTLGHGRTLKLDLEDVYLSIDSAIPLGIILNELVTNALKYSVKGEIKIQLNCKSSSVKLHISDKGPGMKGELEALTKHSLGLKLVTSLTRQLSGTIEQFNEDGCHWVLKFYTDKLKK